MRRSAHARGATPVTVGSGSRSRLNAVVLVFEILLVACVVLVTWFALYALYRLITDES